MTKITLHKVKRKRGSVWMLRWYDSRGRRCGETIGKFGVMTKRQAEAIRRDRQGKTDNGLAKLDRPERMTLGQFADYDRSAIADKAYKTQLGQNHAFDHAKAALGADIQLDRIARAHVSQLKARMQDNNLRPATIDKVVRVLRASFNRALHDGLVTANPFVGAGVRWDPRDSRIFSAEEINAMLAVCPTDWWICFLRLLTTSGLRLNEALHLRWEHVDFEAGMVRVSRQDAGRFTVDGQEYPLLPWTAKAKASYREIPLPDETIAELRRWKVKAGKSAYLFVTLERLRTIDHHRQAGTLRGDYELCNNVLRNFKVIQTRARKLLAERREVKIDKVPWRVGCIHDLRDTYLTSVKGLPIDVLKRIAGHSDLATTLKYYTSPTEQDAASVRAALAASGLSESPLQDTLRTHSAAVAG